MTGFNFDVVSAGKAERLVKKGIKWEEKTRRMLVLRKNKTMQGKWNKVRKMLV